ncbi:MAG: 30S ribosomal protein S19e [Candidatus Aenigmarchaeota archaeon]|nr:30S ribosomal protein S19e [Candidatus Aenigmarchaeota archaeon]
MVSARDAEPQRLIESTAEELKKTLKRPGWADYVKTGVSRERPPEDADWWYMRAASVLRKVYVDGPVGVSRLRSFYGGLHRRGHKPAHFAKGGGKVVRVILQDLEKAGFVKQAEKRKGRIITPAGQKFLNGVAKNTK